MNTTDDKTLRSMIDVMQSALQEGVKIEWKCKQEDDTKWRQCLCPVWDWANTDYRVKPEDKSLGPECFTPGTVVRPLGYTSSWMLLVTVTQAGVTMSLDGKLCQRSFKHLEHDWERSLDGGKTWMPCHK